MRLLVLGASGGCGRHVVRHAIARGHDVTALVRPTTTYQAPAGATVVRDDVLAPGALASIVPGHDVVISCLGIRRRWPRNPWSRLISPPDLAATSADRVIEAMHGAGARRLLAISAAGVGDSALRMNRVMRWLVAHSRIGDQYRDLAVMEDRLAATDLDWCAVRPVTLTARRARPVREVDRFGLTAMIARESVALWLLDHLAGGGDRTPMIAHA